MAKENWPDWPVYIRDHCRCVYCGLDGTTGFAAWQQLDIDHLIPKSRGGTNTHRNKVLSCIRCNLMKGSFDPRGYKADSPTWPEPRTDGERIQLIEAARLCIGRSWKEWESDFRQMMTEISATQI